MSRITKNLAQIVARNLLAKKREAVNKAETALNKWLTDVYKASIPRPVMNVFKKYPKYVETSNGVYIKLRSRNGRTEGRRWILEGPDLPRNSNFSLSGKALSEYKYKIKDLDKKSAELAKLYEETKEAIYRCYTFEGLKKKFPEAAKHLPKELGSIGKTNIDLTGIRKRLK